MRILKLAVKEKYFNEIKQGTKTEEYRLVKKYWGKRLLKEQPEVAEKCFLTTVIHLSALQQRILNHTHSTLSISLLQHTTAKHHSEATRKSLFCYVEKPISSRGKARLRT